ncbi:MAG TPA: COX15/CtaA family protein [Acidimicrobiales bacterium]|jgi:cytochrome c oxidase assembly protein subunit 15|nr:COX15/CtaA family protein [Acidimicrobiales bacterium]
MQLPRLTPRAYRKVTLAALGLLAFIVVTGGAVRVTGSGLGCPDWPACADTKLVDATEYHRAIESINRTITGLVSVAVIVAVLASLLRTPRRADLTRLAWGLVAVVVGQIVLGGLTVIFGLAPPFVMGHFLMSMLLIWCAVVLHDRAGLPDDATRQRTVDRDQARMARLLTVAAAVVLVLGTLVTSSGPHGGDERAQRLPFALHQVTRLHGAAVMLFLAMTVVVMVSLVRGRAAPRVLRRAEVLLGAIVAQAAVGYAQYFTRLPPLLVGIHIAGATAVWIAVLRLDLAAVPVPPGVPAAATWAESRHAVSTR